MKGSFTSSLRSPFVAIGLSLLLVMANVSSSALAAQDIGDARVVVQSVTGALEEEIRTIVLNDSVFQNEAIKTGSGSATELIFRDGSTLTMGENSELALTELIFDPDPNLSKVVMTATVGVFAFVTGELASQAYEIRTPTATIGVRGTAFTFVVALNGMTTVTVTQGVVVVTNLAGVAVTVSTPGLSTTVAPGAVGAAPPPPTPPAPPPPGVTTAVQGMQASVSQATGVAAGAAAPTTAVGGISTGAIAGIAVGVAAAVAAAVAVIAEEDEVVTTTTTTTTTTTD